MRLAERPLADVLAAFRSSSPTPGGGSASALAGALGASLLAMVGSMPKHRAASEQDVERLRAAARRCAELAEKLTGLIDEDSEAYDRVFAAFSLPKRSDAEKHTRSARIQEALSEAVAVPLDVMRRAAETLEAAVIVATFGNRTASSDVGVAIELLTAAHRGARLNVDINLASIRDAEYAGRIRDEARTLEGRCDTAAARANAADPRP